MRWAPPPPADADLPRARELLLPGPSAAVLSRFLAARKWSLEDARAVQAVWWPGRTCTVRYRARARSADGRARHLVLCAEAGTSTRPAPLAPEDFAQRFGMADPVSEEDGVRVWAFPYDPRLPGLPDSSHAPAVRAAAGLLGPVAVAVRPLRYRPGNRAVFRYTVLRPDGERRTLFGKVLREQAWSRTFDGYRSLSGTGFRLAEPRPVDGLGGLVLFPELPGSSLRRRLVAGERLPSPRRLVAEVDRLGRTPWRGSLKVRRPHRTIRSTGRLLAHLLPHRRAEIEGLAEELAALAGSRSATGPTVHGDLYDAQLFVDERFSLGLIDLEDAGPGDALLDWANLSSHLAALSASAPKAGRRPLAYRALLRREVLARTGASEGELAWREALATLLLAPGPFRVQSPVWPRRVEARIDAALRRMAPRAAS